MKYKLWTLSLLLFMLLGVKLDILAGETAGAKIEAVDGYVDFGYVPIGYNFVHYYRITNTGNSHLIINKLVANCDCTNVFPEDTLIKPGDSMDIKIVFGTENYFGPNTRHVSVHTNDPEDSVFSLEYKSYIGSYPKQFRVSPISLFFLPGHESKEIALGNFSDENVGFEIKMEKDSLFMLNAYRGKLVRKEPLKMVVTPKPDIPRGTHETNFTIEYQTEEKEKISVPIKIVRY